MATRTTLSSSASLTRFFAFHTLDLVSRAAAGSYYATKGTEAFCAHFLHAWAVLGVPAVSQLDNEFGVVGGNPSGFTFSQAMEVRSVVRPRARAAWKSSR